MKVLFTVIILFSFSTIFPQMVQISNLTENLKKTNAIKALSGKILFASDFEGNYNTYMIDLDASKSYRMTNTADADRAPRWSFDGTKIVFIRNTDNVWIMDNEANNPQFICKGQSAGFSPNGKELVYSSSGDIYTYNLETKVSKLISKSDIFTGSLTKPDWSPDGKKIIFIRNTIYDAPFYDNILSLDIQASYQIKLTNYGSLGGAERGYIEDIRWSNNGGKIVYSYRNFDYNIMSNETERIRIIDANGSNNISITTSGGFKNPSLSKDDKYILCSAAGRLICFEVNNINSGYILTVEGRICIEPDWFVLQKTGVEEVNKELPKSFMLNQNYPNPFNPNTKIEFAVPKQCNISIKIFDALGREEASLINEFKSAGNYTVEFNAANLSSGIYFYQIKADEFIQTKKMILMK